MNRNTRWAAVAAVATAAFAPAAPAAAAAPQSYCFAKQAVAAGSWVGTYAETGADGSCDPTGGARMESQLTSQPRQTGNVLHITIVWRFYESDGDLLFETEQAGILRLGDGDVVLNGVVTAGERLGARTHDKGYATDAVGSYAGVMRVMG
jgi:hypothetical protein